MFECSSPVLVLHTPTYHPLLEHHTGYIYGLYDMHMSKPRELFFTHHYEALVYALHVGAKMELDYSRRPERLTSEAYLTVMQDDSQYLNMPDFRENPKPHRGQFGQTSHRIQSDVDERDLSDMPVTDIGFGDLTEVKQAMADLETLADDIDFFGEGK